MKIKNRQILEHLGIEQFNEMQQAVDKQKNSKRDLLLLSPTGSGKTLAFLLSILAQIDENIDSTQALVIVPSRELALQIEEVLRRMRTGLTVSCCYGGHSFVTERKQLERSPKIIIGTPGRILDHIKREHINTEDIRQLVLDEFDKSLEFGFEKEMSSIVGKLNQLQKRILTSATLAVEPPSFMYFKDYLLIDFVVEEENSGLSLKAIVGKKEDKAIQLVSLLSSIGQEPTLVFFNHKATLERISSTLEKKGIFHDCFYGGLEQMQRELALCKFRNGSNQLLLTTDLAARGLDIPEIKHIIHYQLPHDEASFIHRNGRTARMHAEGTAYLLLTEEETWRDYVPEVMDYIEVSAVAQNKQSLPDWQTIFISAGKRDKLSKFDIVGACYKKGEVTKEELGRIEVKESYSYLAVKRSVAKQFIQKMNNQRIKKRKVRVDFAR